jgi:hypothetical protein
MALGPGCAVRHDKMKGAARPAAAAVRKNWRRDQGGGAEWKVADAGEGKEAALSFISTA